MTEKEIIKTLECCTKKYGCCDCPLSNDDLCLTTIRKESSSLIKRQQAEVERLDNNIHSMAITMSNSAKYERSEAIKEFAERLKKNFETYTDEEETNAMYVTKLIDITVREMTEEK